MNHRSGSAPSLHSTPSSLAYEGDKLIIDLQSLRDWARGHTDGCFLAAPTTPSSQLAGVGNTTWNVNISVGVVYINGTATNQAAAVDVSIHAGSLIAGFVVGTDCIAAIVCYGAGTRLAVQGTPAAHGGASAPTETAIQTAVDAAAGATGTAWTKLGQTTLYRSADAVVSQTYDNTARPMMGVSENTGFGNWSSFAV